MKRLAGILGLVALGAACVDGTCPKGSQDVMGVCREIEQRSPGEDAGRPAADGGAEPPALRGDGGGAAGSAAPGSDATTPPLEDGGKQDASEAPLADAGTGDSQVPPPITCGDLECDENAECVSGDEAHCACLPGFEGDGLSCEDIDECALGTHTCDPHAICTNTEGSFDCACDIGFEGDGNHCVANPCDPRAEACDTDTSECRVEGDAAACACKQGRDRCDGVLDACNTDLQSDRANCGKCGRACAGSLQCKAGECEQKAVSIALGTRHSCALLSDQRTMCWGANDVKQLLRPTSEIRAYTPAVADLGPALRFDVGDNFACAVLAEPRLMCWGYNIYERIKPGAGSNSPFHIASGQGDVRQVSVGVLSTCLRFANSIECWGANSGDQLGDSAIAENVAVGFDDRVSILLATSQIAVGANTVTAIASGNVMYWGEGDADPRAVVDADDEPVTDAIDIATSHTGAPSFFTCAALQDGHVMCWGDNDTGQLGHAAYTAANVAYAVPVTNASGIQLAGAVQVATGNNHACARRMDGTVACWGQADRLGAGLSGTGAQRSFVEVGDIDDAIELRAGSGHTCVRRATGQVQCWGDNAFGQCGVDHTVTPIAPTPVNVTNLP